jgi:threonine aldolase
MGNLVSVMAQVPRGGEIIAGEGNHTFAHEAANHAVVVGAGMKLLPWDDRGRMDLQQIRDAFRNPEDVHEPLTSLVMLENTHSDSMAQPLPADYVAAVGQVAHEGGVPLHVDGARIFNAQVALNTPVSELLAAADSASFCLSKGLACPVGSLVVGSKELIWRARRARKMVGGGMRQVGVLAAPGLIALRDGPTGMIERLADDHVNARRLAEGIANMPGVVGLDPSRVRTNFVFFELERRELRMPFLDALANEGALMIDYPGGNRIRAVTHYGIETADVDAAIDATRRALATVGLAPAQVAVSA